MSFEYSQIMHIVTNTVFIRVDRWPYQLFKNVWIWANYKKYKERTNLFTNACNLFWSRQHPCNIISRMAPYNQPTSTALTISKL